MEKTTASFLTRVSGCEGEWVGVWTWCLSLCPAPPHTPQPINLTSTLTVGNASLASLKTALTTANWTSLKASGALPAIDLAAARSKLVSQLASLPAWFISQAPAGDMTCYIDPSSGRVTGLTQGGQTFGYASTKSVIVPLSTSIHPGGRRVCADVTHDSRVVHVLGGARRWQESGAHSVWGQAADSQDCV